MEKLIIRPAWDLDEPQPIVLQLIEEKRVTGPAVDLSCGTGENAIAISGTGFPVLGVDTNQPMLRIARDKAQLMQVRRGVCARFKPARLQRISGLGESFQFLLDICYFQNLSREDKLLYALSLPEISQPGGALHLVQYAGDPTGLKNLNQKSAEILTKAGWNLSVDKLVELTLRNSGSQTASLQIFMRPE
jgi:SAM-dependent methyltransferase